MTVPSTLSLKFDVLMWIASLGIEGLTWAAKNKNCIAFSDRDPLNLNLSYYLCEYVPISRPAFAHQIKAAWLIVAESHFH